MKNLLSGLLLVAALGPPATILVLRRLPPPVTAFMLASDYKPVRYQWVGWERISPYAGLAVVAAEDQKFLQHTGFDFESINDALEENRYRRHPRGASTITQQLAKNLFLWSGGSFLRKGMEAYLTMWLEMLLPKRRILELYLNVAEFGPGVYGVEAAARQYFGESASSLSRYQAARLAAVLPNPVRLHADRPSAYLAHRTDMIEGLMWQLGDGYLHGI